MLTWIREKFETVVISGIIGFIAFVFIFYGVFSPKATRGLHEGAVAGTVNGDAVTMEEFNREFKRRLELVKSMYGEAGGSLSEDQIKAMGIRETVFDGLAQRKVLLQQVQKQGLDVADEQIRDAIREIPAFQKDGQFDILKYKQVLEANQYTPGGFEKMVRDDLAAQQWNSYFARRAWVSDEELRREFQLSQEKRKLKYVMLTAETGKKLIKVGSEEIQKYLKEATTLNLVKSQYESRKGTQFKGKTFDDVKETIAQEMIAGSRSGEIQKANEKLAEQLKAALTAKKDSDARANAILKGVGLEVKTTNWVTRQDSFIQGIGDVAPLLKDLFPKGGVKLGGNEQAKVYSLPLGKLVAVMAESQSADLAQFDSQREQLARQLSSRKQRELFQAWLGELMRKAKIDRNTAVFATEKES